MIPLDSDMVSGIMEGTVSLTLKAKMVTASGREIWLDSTEDGDDYYEDVFISADLDDATSQESSFDVGQAVMNSFQFKLNNEGKRFYSVGLSSAEITPYIGLTDKDGNTEWVKKGTFIVEKPDLRSTTVSVTAYDYMQKMEESFSAVSLSYPTTLGKMVSAMCSYCGVTLATTEFPNSTYAVNEEPSDNNYSCRQMLSFIAQIAGCFARFNSDSELELKWYSQYAELNGSEKLDISIYSSLETNESDYTIEGVRVTSLSNPDTGDDAEENEEVLVGDDGFVIAISENPLIPYGSASKAADALSAIIGTTFRPATLETFFIPYLEAGDTVQVTDEDGEIYEVFATNISVGIGGYATIICGSESSSENAAAQYSGSAQAVLSVLEAVRAKFKNLTAEYAEIDFANVNTLEVVDGFVKNLLTAQTFIVGSETAVDLNVTGYLSGVNIYADVITAGTLATSRLLLIGEDSVVYEINAQSSGLSATELTDEVYQNYINGTVIVANSITATQIAAGAITANEIAARTITSENIVAGAITSVEIAAGAVTADKIDVADLYAIQATIGGWSISQTAIYVAGTSTGTLDPDNYGTEAGLEDIIANGYAGTYIGIDGILQYNSPEKYIMLQNGTLTAWGANIGGTITLSGTQNYIKAADEIWLAPGGDVPDENTSYDRWLSYMGINTHNVVTTGAYVATSDDGIQLVGMNSVYAIGLGAVDSTRGIYDYGMDSNDSGWLIYRSGTSQTVHIDSALNVGGDVTANSFIGDLTGTADVATKLGTATVGSATNPIYLDSGVPTALSTTIGGTTKPVYVNAGTITAFSTTVGAAGTPVYMNAGTVTACTPSSVADAIKDSLGLDGYLPLSAGSSYPLTNTLYSQTIYPKASAAYNLGSTGYYWSDAYINTVHSNASEEAFQHYHASSGYGVHFGVGSGGYNRGVYIPSTGNWLIARHTYADSDSSTGYSFGTYIQGPLYYQQGTVDRHDGPIGERGYSWTTSKSVSNEGYAAVVSKSLAPGTWLLIGNVYFPSSVPSSSPAWMAANISETSAEVSYKGRNAVMQTASGTHWGNLQVSHVIKLEETTTVYLNAGQGSGASKSVDGYLQYYRCL